MSSSDSDPNESNHKAFEEAKTHLSWLADLPFDHFVGFSREGARILLAAVRTNSRAAAVQLVAVWSRHHGEDLLAPDREAFEAARRQIPWLTGLLTIRLFLNLGRKYAAEFIREVLKTNGAALANELIRIWNRHRVDVLPLYPTSPSPSPRAGSPPADASALPSESELDSPAALEDQPGAVGIRKRATPPSSASHSSSSAPAWSPPAPHVELPSAAVQTYPRKGLPWRSTEANAKANLDHCS